MNVIRGDEHVEAHTPLGDGRSGGAGRRRLHDARTGPHLVDDQYDDDQLTTDEHDDVDHQYDHHDDDHDHDDDHPGESGAGRVVHGHTAQG